MTIASQQLQACKRILGAHPHDPMATPLSSERTP